MRRVIFAVLSMALLLSIAVPSTRAQSPQTAPAFALSPEEAVIALLPYKLSQQDALPGYSVGALPSVNTAVSLSAQATSPSDAFRIFQSEGFVAGYNQRLLPAGPLASIPPVGGSFIVNLFTDPTNAAGNVDRLPVVLAGTQFSRVTPDNTLGDRVAAWHRAQTPSGQQALGSYFIQWQRGQLNFAVYSAPLPLGQEQQVDAETLAAAVDAIEQGRPPLALGPATVTPPASEAQRFQAASELHGVFLPAGAAPDGYQLSASYLYLHPAETVAQSADPVGALHTIDEQWKQVIRDAQRFTNRENSQLQLNSLITLCADPSAAAYYAKNTMVGPPGWTDTQIAAPIQLGDATYAHLATGVDPDGNQSEGQSLSWTHGAIILSVRMYGPTGTTAMTQVTALAQQVEARFQANALPTRGLPDLTPTATSFGGPPWVSRDNEIPQTSLAAIHDGAGWSKLSSVLPW